MNVVKKLIIVGDSAFKGGGTLTVPHLQLVKIPENTFCSPELRITKETIDEDSMLDCESYPLLKFVAK